MDKKKIPHGIEALREMLIQFDEAGYEPTEPGHAVYGGSSGSDFKNALMVAINECICEELVRFFYDLSEELNSARSLYGFVEDEIEVYFFRYLGVLNWFDKLKDLSYGSLQFEYAGNGNNFQENPPAHRDEEVKETIDAFLGDFDDIVRSGENCLPGIAMRLYDLGWRKQELDNE